MKLSKWFYFSAFGMGIFIVIVLGMINYRFNTTKVSIISKDSIQQKEKSYDCSKPLPKGFTLVQNPYTKKYAIYTDIKVPKIYFGGIHIVTLSETKTFLGKFSRVQGDVSNLISNVPSQYESQFDDSCSAKNYYAQYNDQNIKDSVHVSYDDSLSKVYDQQHIFNLPKDTTIKVTPFDNGDIKKALKKEKKYRKKHAKRLFKKNYIDPWSVSIQSDTDLFNWGRNKRGIFNSDTAYSLSEFPLTRPSDLIKWPEPMDTTLISMGFYNPEYYWFSPTQYDLEEHFPYIWSNDKHPHHVYFRDKEYTEATPTYIKPLPDAYLIGIGIGFGDITTSN